jgi:transglutaminase-like putative cysteine protease
LSPADATKTLMNPRIRLHHLSRYEYSGAVSFSPHLLRLFPRSEPGRFLRHFELQTNPGADVQFRRDFFDNNVARIFYPERDTELLVELTAELELREENAFHFLLDPHAAEYPFLYATRERERLGPFLAPLTGRDKSPVLPFWAAPAGQTPTVDLLMSLISSLNEHIRYETRPDGPARTPFETVELGLGSCRDSARLLMALLRDLGFAARLVSGYLWEPPGDDAAKRRADGSFHAWTEVALPGAGWVGLDGTNGVFCDHHFIACAVGLDAEDITPVSGRYFSDVPVASRMEATLRIESL